MGFVSITSRANYAERSSSCHHKSTSRLLWHHQPSWFKYSDAVEEWCDITKVEQKRRGPAIAARLSGRAELVKERLGC